MDSAMLRSKRLWASVGLLVALGVSAYYGWCERGRLLAWLCWAGLDRAEEASRTGWAEYVASMDQAAIPGLVARLRDANASACRNADAVLDCLVARWDAGDPRRNELSARLLEAFPALSPAGQECVLRRHVGWIKEQPVQPTPLLRTGSRLQAAAARIADPGVHARALDLAALTMSRAEQHEHVGDTRELLLACLRDADVENRVRAVSLAAHPALGLLEHVVAQLSDPAAQVRREAMRAITQAPAAVTTDHILPWLHDSDPDVRLLCEALLRNRGFQGKDLTLARLITARRPTDRMRVLDQLREDPDLEPGIWLRRLSFDAAPEVRVAAIRAGVENPQVDLSDRIDQMIRSDPSPTVSRLARYYLACQHQRKIGR